MKRSLILIAALLSGGCSTGEPGERVERVAADEIDARVMAIAEAALAFCPGPDDADAQPLIRAAERAGWPRFVDDPPHSTDELMFGPSQPGDLRLQSMWKVEPTGARDPWGSVQLVIEQRAERATQDGAVTRNIVGCSISVMPQSRRVPRASDEEIAEATRVMGRLAGSEPTSVLVEESGDPDQTRYFANWTYRMTDDGLERETGEPPMNGELRRHYGVSRWLGGFFYTVGNFNAWSAENAEQAGIGRRAP